MSKRPYSGSARAGKARRYGMSVTGARAFMRAARSYLRTKYGSRRSGEGPAKAVTTQYDSRMLYKRKRAPKGVRRRARRRAKSFVYKQLMNAKSNTNLFQFHRVGAASAAGGQLVTSLTSGYTFCGTGTTGNDSVGAIYDVVQNLTNATPNIASKKYFLTGMSTDYTITNTSASDIAEVDVYEWVARKDFDYNELNPAYCSISNYLEKETSSESKMPGATTAMAFNQLGWVPTDANSAMRNMLILSKQRYYIGPGQAASFVRRHKFKSPVVYGPSDFNIVTQADQVDTFLCRKGITRGIILVYKGLPGAVNAAAAVSIAANAQTRYTMKMLDYEDNKNAINF